MNTTQKAELITLFSQLAPFEQADVLKYVRIRQASQLIYSRPPTAYEWNRLAKWQKIQIMISFFIRCQAYRNYWIQERLRRIKRIETNIIIFFRSFTPIGRELQREWREWEKNNAISGNGTAAQEDSTTRLERRRGTR